MIRQMLVRQHARRLAIWLLVVVVSAPGAIRFLKQFVEFLKATQI